MGDIITKVRGMFRAKFVSSRPYPMFREEKTRAAHPRIALHSEYPPPPPPPPGVTDGPIFANLISKDA